MAQAHLPRPIPGHWHARRGMFLVAGNPEWDRVRAAYDRQLARPTPIVQSPPRGGLLAQLRRAKVRLSWSLDILLGRRR